MMNIAETPHLHKTDVMGSFHRRTLISLCGVMWLKANNLYDLKDKIIKSKADIPNVEGFEFTGVQNDGSCVDCVVKKDGNGLHYIDNFKNIIGWVSKNCP